MRLPEAPESHFNFGYSVEQRRQARQGIVADPVLPGANAWQQGNVYQIKSA